MVELGAYALGQSARIAWYMGHRAAGRRAGRNVPPPPGAPEVTSNETQDAPCQPTPSFSDLLADLARLFARDAANIAKGIYPAPDDGDGSPARRIVRLRAFLADIEPAGARRAGKGRADPAQLPGAEALPNYYLTDFHYQQGGYLTETSAKLYDTQVETLFIGAANAMRRQALAPLVEHFAKLDQRHATLVDIGCSTGRFIHQAKQALPAINAIGIDLSPTYLREAERTLISWRGVSLMQAPGEALPLGDQAIDAGVSIFLFHELPGEVRRDVAREAAQVLKPGAPFVLIDSLQRGDRPDWDGILDGFERSFNEPYYLSYIEDDLEACFADQGLVLTASWTAFLSKVMVFAKAF